MSESLLEEGPASPFSYATLRVADLIPAEGFPAKLASMDDLIRDMITIRNSMEREWLKHQQTQRSLALSVLRAE